LTQKKKPHVTGGSSQDFRTGPFDMYPKAVYSRAWGGDWARQCKSTDKSAFDNLP